jgi:hypothetical protein
MILAAPTGATRRIYCQTMDSSRPSLPQRVTAVLHARQYIVFFSIGLYALSVAVPVLSAWMYRHAGVKDLLDNTNGPLADAVAARSALIAALFVAYLLAMTWLRAGYIRSLVGPFHLRPANRHQFLSLLGFELILEAVAALSVGCIVWAGQDAVVANLVVFALLAFYFVVMYADYIIVIAGTGPLRGILLSWQTVRVTLLPSVAILLVVTLLGELASSLLSDSVTGDFAHALPMLLVKCVLMGVVVFAADVTLVVLYMHAVETGRVRPQKDTGETGTD